MYRVYVVCGRGRQSRLVFGCQPTREVAATTGAHVLLPAAVHGVDHPLLVLLLASWGTVWAQMADIHTAVISDEVAILHPTNQENKRDGRIPKPDQMLKTKMQGLFISITVKF